MVKLDVGAEGFARTPSVGVGKLGEMVRAPAVVDIASPPKHHMFIIIFSPFPFLSGTARFWSEFWRVLAGCWREPVFRRVEWTLELHSPVSGLRSVSRLISSSLSLSRSASHEHAKTLFSSSSLYFCFWSASSMQCAWWCRTGRSCESNTAYGGVESVVGRRRTQRHNRTPFQARHPKDNRGE